MTKQGVGRAKRALLLVHMKFSVFRDPYYIQDDGVIRIEVDDPEILTFLSISQIWCDFDEEEKNVLIETQFLRNLLIFCTTRQEKGVVIRGPSGTGKTTSAIYLFDKLSSKNPLLLCSPRCYNSDQIFYSYIAAFCKGNIYYYSQYNLAAEISLSC